MSAQPHPPSDDDRFGHGLPDNGPPADKPAFVEYCFEVYLERPHWRADTISKYFADDFPLFTLDDFK